MAAGPWAFSNKKSHTEEVYNSVKVLSWHLSSLIFYSAVRPTNMMDYILGTMIVFSVEEKASTDELILSSMLPLMH